MQARSLISILCLLACCANQTQAHPLQAEPLDHAHVPAFEQFYLPEDDDDFLAEGGLLLLAELNCAACHVPPSDWQHWLAPKPGPDLRHAGSRLDMNSLWRFIRSPQHRKPGTQMPGLFAGNEDTDAAIIEALATYLASLTKPPKNQPTIVGDAARGRDLYHQTGCVACHEPASDYRPPSLPAEAALEKPGLPSSPLALADDYHESALAEFLHDPLAVRPASRMPDQHLTPEEAADLAAYLHLDRQPPSYREREILQLAPRTVTEGRNAFGQHRCAACHETGHAHPSPAPLPSLAQLDSAARSGCLSGALRSGTPRFDLSPLQTRALRLALARIQSPPAMTEPGITHELARLHCFACHDHEGRGGPEFARASYLSLAPRLRPNDELENLPPTLDGLVSRFDAARRRDRLLLPAPPSTRFSVRMPRFHPDSVMRLLKAFSAP